MLFTDAIVEVSESIVQLIFLVGYVLLLFLLSGKHWDNIADTDSATKVEEEAPQTKVQTKVKVKYTHCLKCCYNVKAEGHVCGEINPACTNKKCKMPPVNEEALDVAKSLATLTAQQLKVHALLGDSRLKHAANLYVHGLLGEDATAESIHNATAKVITNDVLCAYYMGNVRFHALENPGRLTAAGFMEAIFLHDSGQLATFLEESVVV